MTWKQWIGALADSIVNGIAVAVLAFFTITDASQEFYSRITKLWVVAIGGAIIGLFNHLRQSPISKIVGILGAIILIPTLASASPWLICNPNPNTDFYRVDTDGAIVSVNFQNGWLKDGKVSFTDPGGATAIHVLTDDAGIAVGAHTQRASACKAAIPPWNEEVCSAASSPLAFTRPAPATAPSVPTGLQLSP